MYILHSHLNSRRRRRGMVLAGLVLLVVAGGGFYGRQLLDTPTTIGPAPAAVVTHVTDSRKAVKLVDDRLFSFELPQNWETFVPATVIAGERSWRNATDNKGVRVLTVYTDAAVQNLAVNRVVSVEPSAAGLTLTGDVSDNCVNFTDPGKQPGSSGQVAAKWQGVQFLCDSANYNRNVVGIATPASLNSVKLSGSAAGTHSLFITYADSSSSPDFGIFTAMLRSFKMK